MRMTTTMIRGMRMMKMIRTRMMRLGMKRGVRMLMVSRRRIRM